MKNLTLSLLILGLIAGCGGGGGGGGEDVPSGNASPTLSVDGASPGQQPISRSVAEGTAEIAVLTASDDRGTPSISLSGTDADLFNLSSSGQLSFIDAPDFETPQSAAGSNVYEFTVTVSDGSNSPQWAFEVTVLDLYDGSGRVIDGPVAFADVYIDLNCNKTKDEGEPEGQTDANGFFEVSADAVAAEGCSPKIVATGGTDIATGKPFTGVLKADVPSDQSKVSAVTPLTTVLAAAPTPEAKTKVLVVLGLSGKTPEEIATTDSWAASEAGDETAQAIQRVNTQVATVLKTATKVAEGGGSDAGAISDSVASAIVSAAEDAVEAAAETGETASVSLADPAVVKSAVSQAASDAGKEVDDAVVTAISNTVSVLNTAAADPNTNPTSTTAIQIAQASEDAVENDVAAVVSGETSVEEFEEATSTEQLFESVVIVDAPDFDEDGIADTIDSDDDNDGVLDTKDAFPKDASETLDTDGDGVGNNADDDDDGDGVADSVDAFPLNKNESVDTDSDGIGNNADTDDDNDGYLDTNDDFPLVIGEWLDTDNDGIGNNADTDDDGDGVPDNVDIDPLDNSVGGNGLNVIKVAVNDYTDGLGDGTTISLVPSVAGGVLSIAPKNALDLSNLNSVSSGAGGKAPVLYMGMSSIPSDGEYGTLTVTATMTEGADATRGEGERSVTSSLDIAWSSDGQTITVTVPAQSTSIVATLEDGTTVEGSATNAGSDAATFGMIAEGTVPTLGIKIANFLGKNPGEAGYLAEGLFRAGSYFLEVDIAQDGLANLFYQGAAFNRIEGLLTVSEKVKGSITDAFIAYDVSISDPAQQDTIELYPMVEGDEVDFTMWDQALSADTLNGLANGELSSLQSPVLQIGLEQLPDDGSSGSFTISVKMTEGADATRSPGERSVSSSLDVYWSSTGDVVTATVLSQTATITVELEDGTVIESLTQNVDSDSLSFSYAGPSYPTSLDAKISAFLTNENEASLLADIFRAGAYHLDIELEGLDNLYFQDENVTSARGVLILE